MPHTLDYFMAPSSPWTYLGHQRLLDLCAARAIPIRMMPIDLGKVFPQSGGLPLPQRAPQRQAYRLVELARWRDVTGLPLNVQPRFFPVSGDDAALVLIGAQLHHGDLAGFDLAGRILRTAYQPEARTDLYIGFSRQRPLTAERQRIAKALEQMQAEGWIQRAAARYQPPRE